MGFWTGWLETCKYYSKLYLIGSFAQCFSRAFLNALMVLQFTTAGGRLFQSSKTLRENEFALILVEQAFLTSLYS